LCICEMDGSQDGCRAQLLRVARMIASRSSAVTISEAGAVLDARVEPSR
jgi:hypothetical protein